MTQDNPTQEGLPTRPAGPAGPSPWPVQHPRVPRLADRRWVFRSTVLLACGAVALCFLVAWRRDEATIHTNLDSLAQPVKELQAQIDALGRLPATPPQQICDLLSYYVSDADRFYASQTSDPMIIAVTGRQRMLFESDGRAVIMYEKGRVWAKWMSESTYQAAWEEQERKTAEFEEKRKAQPIVLP